jgi:hypothetical protein
MRMKESDAAKEVLVLNQEEVRTEEKGGQS